jgi:MYXO-CTERM domain-containing protein
MSHPEPNVPADPSGIPEPHDVLAADEFGIGTRVERLPPDPNRFDPPHDVLAAEEFAIPAGGLPHEDGDGGSKARWAVPLLLLAAVVALRRVRRRR